MQGAQRRGARRYPAEDAVLPVEVGSLVKEDEELRVVGMLPFVRHRQHPGRVVLQRHARRLILELLAVDGLSALCASRRDVRGEPALRQNFLRELARLSPCHSGVKSRPPAP